MQTIPLQEFLDFARAKPADEAYDFSDIDHCAIAQFGQFKFPGENVGANSHAITLRDRDNPEASWESYKVLFEPALNREDNEVVENPWTWGALADRLQARIEGAN